MKALRVSRVLLGVTPKVIRRSSTIPAPFPRHEVENCSVKVKSPQTDELCASETWQKVGKKRIVAFSVVRVEKYPGAVLVVDLI